MRKRIPLALAVLVVVWLPAQIELLAVEERSSQKPDAVPFEQIPDLLRKTDEALKAKADALVAVVDAEVKAKRVSPAILQSLRTAVMNVNPETGLDAQKVLTNASLPMDNEAVANAVNAFQEASAVAQNQRPADFRAAMI